MTSFQNYNVINDIIIRHNDVEVTVTSIISRV